MANKDLEKSEKENREKIKEQEKSDPGTTEGPDPQEHMEGPVSSAMHIVEESFEKKENNDEAPE